MTAFARWLHLVSAEAWRVWGADRIRSGRSLALRYYCDHGCLYFYGSHSVVSEWVRNAK